MRMGRPPKGDEAKNYSLHLRVDNDCGRMLEEMTEATGQPRVYFIETGIRSLYAEFALRKRKEEK